VGSKRCHIAALRVTYSNHGDWPWWSGRVGRGGVGEKPLEGFAPTGPASPNLDPSMASSPHRKHKHSLPIRRRQHTRNRAFTKERRLQVARKAAAARWGKKP
jgi:hypothetical protein